MLAVSSLHSHRFTLVDKLQKSVGENGIMAKQECDDSEGVNQDAFERVTHFHSVQSAGGASSELYLNY